MAEVYLPPPRRCRFLRPQPMTRTRSGTGGQRSRGPASPPEKRGDPKTGGRKGERKRGRTNTDGRRMKAKEEGMLKEVRKRESKSQRGGEQKEQSHGVRSQNRATSFRKHL